MIEWTLTEKGISTTAQTGGVPVLSVFDLVCTLVPITVALSCSIGVSAAPNQIPLNAMLFVDGTPAYFQDGSFACQA